ncbi:MAG TPA: T9SS type A sorting domain-containing protein [Chitinophagaceae bacterium]|nr:T9SS type A sorting domain-containing protein [Chitinophagaceae bacterium]
MDLTRGALQCRRVIPVNVGGNYVPMQLNFSTSDNTQCGSATADGRIQLSASKGRPYSSGYKYELLSPAAFQASNTTGIFDQLPAGVYTVRAYDSCGNFQTRDISIANTRSTYNFDAYLSTRIACDTVQVYTYLFNNQGQLLTDYTGFSFGYYDDNGVFVNNLPFVNPILLPIKRDTCTIFFSDLCGNVMTQFVTIEAIKYKLGYNVREAIVKKTCIGFSIDLKKDLINVGKNPLFTITCAPDVSLVGQTSSGIFNDLPYGHYCFSVGDECGRVGISDFTVGDVFTLPRSSLLANYCNEQYGNILLRENYDLPLPITMEVVDSVLSVSGTVLKTVTFYELHPYMVLADSLPVDRTLYFRFTDECGNSNTVGPYTFTNTTIHRWNEVVPLCINKADLRFTASLVTGTITPVANATGPAGFLVPDHYFFKQDDTVKITNVGVGRYIIKTFGSFCTAGYFDTLDVLPYEQPILYNSTSFACDPTITSNYSVQLNVKGGYPEILYEITGSYPNNITRPLQNNPDFYGLPKDEIVQMRVRDACGNSASNAVTIRELVPGTVAISGIACAGNSVTLKALSLAGGIYVWKKGGVVVSSGVNDSTYTINPVSATDYGSYTVDLSVAAGCTSVQSSYALNDQCTVLPVTLLDFSGYQKNAGNFLTWKTDDAAGLQAFILQSSADGIQFTDIGKFQKAEHVNQYNFTDRQPLARLTYYRLQLLSAGGSATYSPVIGINNGSIAATQVLVAPNPFTEEINIRYQASGNLAASIVIYSADGRVVSRTPWNLQAGPNTQTIHPLPAQANGVYILKLEAGSRVLYSGKIIKR